MRPILVLGYFGYNTNQLDGQTVKTRDVYKLLSELYRGVEHYDTEEFKFRKLSILKMFWKIINSSTICYLPAHNNLKYIFPVIFCLSFVFRIRIHYFVVGGWLADFIKDLPVHRFMLSHIQGIHVETNKLKDDLETLYGFNNVDLFPNFRYFKFDENNSIRESRDIESIKLVFVSRVDQTKGLDTLLKVSEILVERELASRVSIDFYGQKKDDFFDNNLSTISMYKYKGELQPEQVIETISKYDALIFPTHYEGEGCPGILIEALAAGLPIIASNWKYNGEFIVNDVNGFLCEVLNAEQYVDAIQRLLYDKELLRQMSASSYMKSRDFSAANAKLMIENIVNNI